MKIGALSGSLTKLLDGTSYLVAGTNITITTGSNEAVTIDATGGGGSPGGSDTHVQYNNGGAFGGVADFTYDTSTLQLTGSLIQANNGTNTVGFMGNLSAASPLTIGTDVFFFVSGSRDVEVSVFGGDLIVSGAMTIGGPASIEGDSLEVTGTITATQGFSGSLTTLSDGTSYIIAGNNISIVSASNGPITIGALPGGSDTEIQYNSGSSFTGSLNFTYNGSSVFLTGSFSQGSNTVALGAYSHAEGSSTTASGNYSHVEGVGTASPGEASHAEGANTVASGSYSHSEGLGATAASYASHAEGNSTFSGYKGFLTTNITAGAVVINSSYGDISSLFTAGSYILLTWTSGLDLAYEISSVSWDGTNTTVTLVDTSINDVRPGLIGIRGTTLPAGADQTTSGVASHAEGYQTIAQPRYSHAEGYQTLALAVRSHAEGELTTTLGIGSHSEGLGTIASGSYQHVGGKFNVRDNDFSLFVVGNGISTANVDRSDVLRVNSGSVGDGRVEVTGSLAATMGLSGSLTQLVDGTSYLVAGTNITITSASNGAVTIDATATSPGGSDTEIQYNSGGSFAGSSNFTYNGSTVFLSGSLSNGLQTVASGTDSHAEGRATTASGDFSHSEGGTNTIASGEYSHAEGDGSIASGIASHAEGDNTHSRGSYSHAEGYSVLSSGSYSHAEGSVTNAIAEYSHAEGYYTYAGSHALQVTSIINGVISIDSSHGDVSGFFSAGAYVAVVDAGSYSNGQSFQIATSAYAGFTQVTLVDTAVNDTPPTLVAAVGYPGIVSDYSIGSAAHSEGNSTNALGSYSHSEGSGSIAVGLASHAEGQQSVARGQYSHSEGGMSDRNTEAIGDYSHAEGAGTYAIGTFSHSEGYNTEASGSYSHTEGQGTIASGSYQHVGGTFNLRNNDFSLFVIGNGTSDADVDRSDILRVNTDSMQVSGSLIVSGAYIHNVVSGTTSPTYAIGAWDHVVVFTDNVVTATLPSASPIGRKIIFKDGTGAASTAGGQMLSCSLGIIDGAATYTMASVDYTAVSVIKINDPDEWIVV